MHQLPNGVAMLLSLLEAFSAAHVGKQAAAHTIWETDNATFPTEQQAQTEGWRDAEHMAPALESSTPACVVGAQGHANKSHIECQRVCLLRAEASWTASFLLPCWEVGALALW